MLIRPTLQSNDQLLTSFLNLSFLTLQSLAFFCVEIYFISFITLQSWSIYMYFTAFWTRFVQLWVAIVLELFVIFVYVSLQLHVQNAVSAQPCVGKLGISLVLLNFLHCNFRLWFETT